MIDSPPRRDARPDPGTAPESGRAGAAPLPASPPTRRRERARLLAFGALAVVVVLHLVAALGFLFLLTTVPPELDLRTGPRSPSIGPSPAPSGDAPTVTPGPTTPNPVAPGVRVPSSLRATVLDIPKLGIRQYLLELGVDARGALQPPTTPDVAGWFTGAAVPGDQGPTVIAGHVDSQTGPGVFFALKDLVRGDVVAVGRSDGQLARYRVTDVQTVDKDRFPTQQVYGPTAGAELRLITCGGSFDRVSGHYQRNVVVSAVLVDPS